MSGAEGKPVLLTEAGWREFLAGYQTEPMIAELRERGLIAPEPVDPLLVDPLLVEAREMFVGLHERGLNLTLRLSESESGLRGGDVYIAKIGAANNAIRAGDFDGHERLQELLAALRRGMTLAPAARLTREMVAAAWAHCVSQEDFVGAFYTALTQQMEGRDG